MASPCGDHAACARARLLQARTTLAVTSLARSTPSQNSGMPAGAAPPPGASPAPAPAAIASTGGSSSPFTILARVSYSGAARARAFISRRLARPQAACACSPRPYRRPLLALLSTGARAPHAAALRQQRCAQAGLQHLTGNSVNRQRAPQCLQARRSCSASFDASASRLPCSSTAGRRGRRHLQGACQVTPSGLCISRLLRRSGCLDKKQRRNTVGLQQASAKRPAQGEPGETQRLSRAHNSSTASVREWSVLGARQAQVHSRNGGAAEGVAVAAAQTPTGAMPLDRLRRPGGGALAAMPASCGSRARMSAACLCPLRVCWRAGAGGRRHVSGERGSQRTVQRLVLGFQSAQLLIVLVLQVIVLLLQRAQVLDPVAHRLGQRLDEARRLPHHPVQPRLRRRPARSRQQGAGAPTVAAVSGSH